MSTNWLGEFIAKFNEEHGVTGLQIGSRVISNEELRMSMPIDEHPAKVFVEANLGKTFKRPKGWRRYTIIGVAENPHPGFGPIMVVRVQKDDGVVTHFATSAFDEMVEVPES